MTLITTTIRLQPMPLPYRGGLLPHASQIMPVIDGTLKCNGKVIVIPPTTTNKSRAVKMITYLALAHLVEDGTTVIIG